MPGRNGTGPLGAGPLTGRGLGYCIGSRAAECVNPLPGYGVRGRSGGFGQGFGRGYGRGGGYGRGYGRGFGGRGYGRGFGPFYGQGYGGCYDPEYVQGAVNPDYYGPPQAEAEKEFLTSQVNLLNEHLSQLQKRISELEEAEKEENKE